MRGSGTRQTRHWLLPVVLVAVAVTAAGGLLARELYATADQPVTPAAIIPSVSSLPAAEQPGPRNVQATKDATEHPLYETVRQLLQTYFDAINGKNYARWKTTVTEARIQDMPEAAWQASYRSTQDGSIVVYRIETGPTDRGRVMLTFVSKQDVSEAPLELPEPCIKWNVIFAIAVEDGTWKIDAGATGASPQHEKC